jgi:hypothetical protein
LELLTLEFEVENEPEEALTYLSRIRSQPVGEELIIFFYSFFIRI